MLFDALNRFSKDQTVSATAASENVIDLGAERDLGVANQLEIAVCPQGEISGTGTLAVSVETSDTEAFTTAVTLASSGALSAAALNAGAIGMKMPYGTKRYLRLKYTVAGTSPTISAKITAGIVLATAHAIEYKHYMHS